MIWIQALIILACIMLGARKSGVAMGFAGGVGLFILVFVFGLKPASPPVNVLLIIIAVSSMAATLQVAGGLDLLVHLAEKVLRSRPNYIHGAYRHIFVYSLHRYELCGTGRLSRYLRSCSGSKDKSGKTNVNRAGGKSAWNFRESGFCLHGSSAGCFSRSRRKPRTNYDGSVPGNFPGNYCWSFECL